MAFAVAVTILWLATIWAVDGGRIPPLWPGGVIPYDVDGALAQKLRYLVGQAMQAIQQNTCVRFEYRPGDPRSVYFRMAPNPECIAAATLGADPRGQRVMIYGCVDRTDFRLVSHELLHVVGLSHEHSRIDSDQYITKYGSRDPDVGQYDTRFGMPYDYYSVMHYGRYTPWFQIITRDQRYQNVIGNAPGPDQDDYRKVCIMYNCQCGGGGNRGYGNNRGNRG